MPEFCGISLAHPVINASGTYDAIAARTGLRGPAARGLPLLGLRLEDDHPRAAAGNAPQRIWETPAGMINSIGLPEQGTGGVPGRGPAAAGRTAGAADRLGDGDQPRGLLSIGRGGGGAGRGRGDRAQRLLPQRPLRPDRRRAAERDRGAAGSAAPADREAADREADAERRRPGRGRGRPPSRVGRTRSP